MSTIETIINILEDIECEPYAFRVDCILCVRAGVTIAASIANPFGQTDEGIPLSHAGVDHVFFLQAKLWRKDADSGMMGWGKGAKKFISPYASSSEICRIALNACLGYAEHEVREAFQYQGKRIFGPHISAAGLMEAAEDIEVRD